jgi:hypothetical protein
MIQNNTLEVRLAANLLYLRSLGSSGWDAAVIQSFPHIGVIRVCLLRITGRREDDTLLLATLVIGWIRMSYSGFIGYA